jgi:uncharacterized membrane protein YgdD (TMEM256/DUF423 family)
MTKPCPARGDGDEKTGDDVRMQRWFGTLGAIFALLGVVLAALASHTLAPRLLSEDLRRVFIAAAFLMLHGVALIQFAILLRQTRALLVTLAGFAVALGTVAFSGALVGRALYQWSSAPAPIGGALLMAGWALIAVFFAFQRRA